jgi:hypothetical protein
MTQLMRILVFGVAVFNLALGMIFLLAPTRIAPAFNVLPAGVQGVASLRADFSAFFLCGAAFALVGAWRQASAPLRVPLLLLGIALSGRLIGVVVDGVVATTLAPMVAEFAMIVILALAYRRFDTAARGR